MGVNYYFDDMNKPVFEIGKKVLDTDGNPVSDKHGIKLSDKEIFNSSDFEEIQNIICNQNLIDRPDETIQKEIRDKMDEARMMKQEIVAISRIIRRYYSLFGCFDQHESQ